MPRHNNNRTVPAHNCIYYRVYLLSIMILVDRCYSKLHFPVRKLKLRQRSDLELAYRSCLEQWLVHNKCHVFLLLVSLDLNFLNKYQGLIATF